MPTLIMLTRLNPDAVRSPRGLEQLERDAMKRVREECPGVDGSTATPFLVPAITLMSSSPQRYRNRGPGIGTHSHVWPRAHWNLDGDGVGSL